MPPPSKIDHPQLLEIKKRLRKLPRPHRVKTYTGQEALEALADEIRELSSNGYNPKEIAGLLKNEGLSASAAKVKRILAGEAGAQASKPEAGPGLAASNGDDEAGPAKRGSSRPPPAMLGPVTTKPKSNGKEAQL